MESVKISPESEKKVDSSQEDYKEGELCTYNNGIRFEYVKKVFTVDDTDVYLVKTQIQLNHAKRIGPNMYNVSDHRNPILKSIKIDGSGEFKYCIVGEEFLQKSESVPPIGFLAQESVDGYLDMFSAQNSGVLKQYNGDSIESDKLLLVKSLFDKHSSEFAQKLFPNQGIWLYNKINTIVCFKTDPGEKEINCTMVYYNAAFVDKLTKKFRILRYSI